MQLRSLIVALVIGVAAAGPPAGPVLSLAPALASGTPVPAGEPALLVRFRPSLPEPVQRAVVAEHGARIEVSVPGTGFVVVSTEGDPDAVQAALAADPRVAAVERNHTRRASVVPDDLYWSSAQSTYFDPIRLPEAWDITTGSDDLVLAVVDSGVDLEHPDLHGRLLPGWDFVNDDDQPIDDFGHGTQVATIAAATTNNRSGIAGVAWQGKVLPVKVLNDKGVGTDAAIAAGITWAADHGADVINLSFGGSQPGETLAAAVDYARRAGAILVSAAGNSGSPVPNFPAALEGVIAVSATDRNGNLAWFSNYGPTIDVAAPGVDIVTGTRDGPYKRVEGTSFAAPVVAGVAMLARARFPDEDASATIDRIRRTARDAGPLGIDDYFGSGIVDALAAVGGPAPEPRVDASAAGREPDNTPDRATPVGMDSPATASISPEGDVDWFAVDVPNARWLEFSVIPPAGGGARRMDAVLELYGPGLRFMDKADTAISGGAETIVQGMGPGRYYLRVSNLLATASPGPYQVRVNPTGDPDAPGFGFLGGESHGLAGYPESVAIGDLTGDGANDIVVTTHFGNSEHGRLLIYPQHLTRLGPVTEVVIGARGPSGLGVALGDVDLDGDLDAVVATNAGVEIHHQSGGGLLPAVLIPLVGASHVEIGDVDGDRRPDLVIGTGSTGVRLLRNRADGVFDLSTITNAWTPEIEVADVNLDDRADVVLWECPEDCTEGAVYYGRSDVTFSRSALAVPDHSPPVAVGDFTRDGRPDIVVAHGPVVDVLAQDGAGRFSGVAGWTHGEGYWPSAIEMADMDADGHLEVLVLHQPTGKLVASAWSNGQSSMIGEYPLHGSQAYPLKGLAIGDVDSDSRPDVAAVDQYRMLYALTQQAPIYVTPDPGGDHVWVRDTVPADGAGGADPAVAPTIRFGRPLDPASVTSEAFSLLDGFTGAPVPAGFSYDPATGSAALHPHQPLIAGRSYLMRAAGLRDLVGNTITPTFCCLRFRVAGGGGAVLPPPGVEGQSGYWMVAADGAVYSFGDAAYHGGGLSRPGTRAVDLEPTPSGNGYWIVDATGVVTPHGDAPWLGNAGVAGEEVTSISATPTGAGYWLFTTTGRVLAFGDAAHFGDLAGVRLNGPVLDSIVTPSGRGYYMVASDGGIFSFGDARFFGSMGGIRLNAPVQSLVPDPDGTGYWLVASDGGVFSFETAFRGSLGGVALNRPVNGMVPFGNGYLMVAEDGGIFNFSDRPFRGSLGASPPAHPIVAVAALRV